MFFTPQEPGRAGFSNSFFDGDGAKFSAIRDRGFQRDGFQRDRQFFAWTIATAAGGIRGFDASDFSIHTAATNGTNGFTNDLSGGTFSLAVVDGNNLNLVYQQTSAVPEPSGHLALLALGSAGLLTRRRLKRTA